MITCFPPFLPCLSCLSLVLPLLLMGKERRRGGSGRGKNSFDIQPGMAGVMATCGRQQEARCTSEIAQLLDKALEGQRSGGEGREGEGEGEAAERGHTSFAEEIAREVAALRDASARPYQTISTGDVGCIVFMKLAASAGDPVQLVRSLFVPDDAGATNAARFCQRIIPLSRIFRAHLEELKREAAALFGPVFHQPDGPRRTYAVQFESRLSHNLDRRTVIAMLADMIGSRHKVDLENPELTVMIQVFKGMCGISILPSYTDFRKYNIQEFHRAHQQ